MLARRRIKHAMLTAFINRLICTESYVAVLAMRQSDSWRSPKNRTSKLRGASPTLKARAPKQIKMCTKSCQIAAAKHFIGRFVRRFVANTVNSHKEFFWPLDDSAVETKIKNVIRDSKLPMSSCSLDNLVTVATFFPVSRTSANITGGDRSWLSGILLKIWRLCGEKLIGPLKVSESKTHYGYRSPKLLDHPQVIGSSSDFHDSLCKLS